MGNIEALFEKEKIAALIIPYLRRYGVYKYDDSKLVDSLAKLCPKNENPKEFTECLSKYEILSKLRKKAFKRESPFQYESKEVDIGFPDKEPNEGKFFTCKNNEFLGKKIEISNFDRSKVIERESGGSYNCTRKKFPDIQLNKKDGEKLFDKLSKYNKGFATVIECSN